MSTWNCSMKDCGRAVRFEHARLLSIHRTDSMSIETGVTSVICIECAKKIMKSVEGWE